MSFKTRVPLEKRQQESKFICNKYTDRLPVIIEKASRSDIGSLQRCKFLVPNDLTIGQLVYVIREHVKIEPEKAIFIFINNTLPPTAALLSQIFKENADPDGFLYVQYSGESTFGG